MRLCAREDQQISRVQVSFKESDLYAPVLMVTGTRLSLALAAAEGAKNIKTGHQTSLLAAEGAKNIKTDTQQAYLYGDMGDDLVYI